MNSESTEASLDQENSNETVSETTSLLNPEGGVAKTAEDSPLSCFHRHYDSVTPVRGRSSAILQPIEYDENPTVRIFDTSLRSHWRAASRSLLMLSGVLLLLVIMSPLSLKSQGMTLSTSSGAFARTMGLSDFVLGPTVSDSNINTTFMHLAQAMVPAWYDLMLSQFKIVLTPDMQPSSVYKARKIILKTRDLMDVFSTCYPNASKNNNNSHDDDDDLWHSLRHYTAGLYRSVGEFQDLHNAHVRYSQEQMERRRNSALQWKSEFEDFRHRHPDIPSYLRAPTAFQYYHKESHLFWEGVTGGIPAGADPVTPSLQKLGVKQMQNARHYLTVSLTYQNVMNEKVHGIYHNLRKQLRSITDEYDLFLQVMFPTNWAETSSAINILKKGRKLLGDINDDWTSYSIYSENDEYHLEQERLALQIENGWTEFKVWVEDANFARVLDFLESAMEVEPSLAMGRIQEDAVSAAEHGKAHTQNGCRRRSSTTQIPSLLDFLQERKRKPTRQLVIGNEAGDADTIMSAIALAFIESVQEQQEKTPIVAIPEVDLETQRPEVTLLLQLAGIEHPKRDLLFVDNAVIESNSYGAQVTLVDHNVVSDSLQDKNWTIVEIVDHHEDEADYLDTCSGNSRTIAFADDQALVASACTLVAERLRRDWPRPYPASVGLLLLGVILLDSVNLSQQVGKVTQRDQNAVADLLHHSDWQGLRLPSRDALQICSSSPLPDPTLVFTLLQDAKYDSRFWRSLSIRDALRLDYKEFPYAKTHIFGVSTVLMPMEDFAKNSDLVSGVLQYMDDVRIKFLGIMFAYQDNSGRLYRQFAICGTKGVPLADIAAFLLRTNHPQGSLELEEAKTMRRRGGLNMRFYDQWNVKPSRKQIGPMLLEYFESTKAPIGEATS